MSYWERSQGNALYTGLQRIRTFVRTKLNLVRVLRWGWVFLKRTQILSRIQFTRHFIEFIVVETKQFVGSNVNVILMRQTCGQRSSTEGCGKQTPSARNRFPERICYMFLVSKCIKAWDLDLCNFWVPAKREPLRSGDSRKKTCFARRKNQNLALRSGSLFASTQKMHRPRSQSCLHSDM